MGLFQCGQSLYKFFFDTSLDFSVFWLVTDGSRPLPLPLPDVYPYFLEKPHCLYKSLI